jgi:hypothetical protein
VADLSLKYLLFGEDRTASKAIKGVGTQAGSTGSLVGKSLSGIGSMVGGEIGDMIDRVTSGFDSIGAHQKGMSAKIVAGGAAIMGIGAAVQAVGSADSAATAQLSAAIKAQGGDISDYKDEIEGAIKKQETFGHTADDTSLALTALTEATGSPTKAISQMGLVADLAAAKHTNLAGAADMVARILAGKGAKTLAMYGITMDSVKTATSALTSATKAHESAVTTLQKAQQKLADLEAIDHAKKKLTISDQIALRNAHDNVTKALAGLKTSTVNMDAAQVNANKATHAADDAAGKLADKLKGQAAAAVDSFTGKISVMAAKATDATAQFGQKFGPAIMIAGVAVSAFGTIMQVMQGRQAAAAAATALAAAATLAEGGAFAAGTAPAAAFGAAVELGIWPLTLIVAGVAALVAAIVLIATKTTWFQTIWQYTTSSIGAAWTWLWNSILQPVIHFILEGFASVATSIGHVLQALGNVPGFGWAKTAGDMLVRAGNAASTLAGNLKQIKSPPPVTITITAKTAGNLASTFASQVPKFHARGTMFAPGGLSVLGEEGPELVNLPRGSQVYTAGQTRSMLAGGGSGATLTIENYNEAHQPPHVIAAELAFRLRTA